MKYLTNPFTLIGNALKIYFNKDNFWYIVKIIFITGLPLYLLIVPFLVFSGMISAKVLRSLPLVLVPLSVILLLIVITMSLWFEVVRIEALIQIARGETLGIRETFRLAWKKICRFFAANLLAGAIISLGFLLLVIPGIIFSVWYSFVSFIVLIEGLSVVGSLKESKHLVSGFFWPIAGRNVMFVLLAAIVAGILSIIPIAGSLILVFLSPCYTLLAYLLYEDVKRTKGSGLPVQ